MNQLGGRLNSKNTDEILKRDVLKKQFDQMFLDFDSEPVEILNYIDGRFESSQSKKLFDVINPYTEKLIAKAPQSDADDAHRALSYAKKAFADWSKTSSEMRSKILHQISDLILEYADGLARIESKDNGKPFWLARNNEIPRAAANFRFFAEAITSFHSEAFDMGNQGLNYSLRQPLGPVVCISPWNLPLYLLSWKIAPALAAGNTVVAKPSEVTPLSAYFLSKICEIAGLPPGVLNIVHGHGSEVGEALVKNHQTRAVSFTGGTKTGKAIAMNCAERLIPTSLELGGKNAALVFPDCDIELTIKELIRASFTNSGQICLCSSRILIHESIYETFKEKFILQAKALRLGDPSQDTTNLGPLVSEQHLKKVKAYVDLAEKDHATILLDGRSELPKPGYFLAPTVIAGLKESHTLHQEEIFGPVVCLLSFKSTDEAITIANKTPYGLSATLWTTNLDLAHRAAQRLDVGIVWINGWLIRDLRTPFGGTKASGLGREGGVEALRFFTEPKNVCIKFGDHHERE